MQKFLDENKKLIQNLLIILGLIVGVYIFFHYLLSLISPFVLGYILSLIFSPLVNLLEKKCKVPRGIGTMIAIALLLFLCFFVIQGIFSQLISEGTLFYQSLPSYIDGLKESIAQIETQIDKILSYLPASLQNMLKNNSIDLGQILQSFLSNEGGLSKPVAFVTAIPNALVVLIMGFISAYFFTKDRDKVNAFILRHMPQSIRENYAYAKKNMAGAVVGYIKAQLILMMFTFLICMLGFFLLDSPYALLLSVVTSLIDMLPFFGSGFILWPGALIHFIMGNTGLAIGYIIMYLLITLVRNILQPKVLGTQIGMHPLLTLFSMFLGLKLIGVLGMIIGPLIAVVVKGFYDIQEKRKQEEQQEQTKMDKI